MTAKVCLPVADTGGPRADWRQLCRCAPAFALLTGEYERLDERVFREEGAEAWNARRCAGNARLESAIALQLQRCQGGCRGLSGH
ncbi:hypothetical protein [Phytopseudomonas daroniae]|uniref:hypothetical protein n=1 Tax=Phytopseudomonas daroniae TaxID=2487519 RepID=UPI0010383E01|nr:hypothetical protein [Pseudomonas daroniae]TBU76357.1 hypothetical protein DNK10_10340 [Pseudomonas daroniae]